MGMVARLFGHRPTPPSMGGGSATSPRSPKGRTASDRYLKELDEKLNADPQFLRDLEETPPRQRRVGPPRHFGATTRKTLFLIPLFRVSAA